MKKGCGQSKAKPETPNWRAPLTATLLRNKVYSTSTPWKISKYWEIGSDQKETARETTQLDRLIMEEQVQQNVRQLMVGAGHLLSFLAQQGVPMKPLPNPPTLLQSQMDKSVAGFNTALDQMSVNIESALEFLELEKKRLVLVDERKKEETLKAQAQAANSQGSGQNSHNGPNQTQQQGQGGNQGENQEGVHGGNQGDSQQQSQLNQTNNETSPEIDLTKDEFNIDGMDASHAIDLDGAFDDFGGNDVDINAMLGNNNGEDNMLMDDELSNLLDNAVDDNTNNPANTTTNANAGDDDMEGLFGDGFDFVSYDNEG